jgi:hypothetical protein
LAVTIRFKIVAENFRNPQCTNHAKTSIVAGLVNIAAGFWPGSKVDLDALGCADYAA